MRFCTKDPDNSEFRVSNIFSVDLPNYKIASTNLHLNFHRVLILTRRTFWHFFTSTYLSLQIT
jgi:hypothetical protein